VDRRTGVKESDCDVSVKPAPRSWTACRSHDHLLFRCAALSYIPANFKARGSNASAHAANTNCSPQFESVLVGCCDVTPTRHCGSEPEHSTGTPIHSCGSQPRVHMKHSRHDRPRAAWIYKYSYVVSRSWQRTPLHATHLRLRSSTHHPPCPPSWSICALHPSSTYLNPVSRSHGWAHRLTKVARVSQRASRGVSQSSPDPPRLSGPLHCIISALCTSSLPRTTRPWCCPLCVHAL
jgi:hypothetical protein